VIDLSVVNDPILSTFREPDGVVSIDGIGDVDAIYDSRHYAIEEGIAAGSSLVTSIGVRTEIAEQVTIGSTQITARGIVYVAKEKRPDGEGWTIIELERRA